MTDISLIQNALEALLPKFGSEYASVEQLRRLSGGASQETWSFKLSGAGEPVSKILRRAPGGNVRVNDSQGIGLETEAAIIKVALDAGVKAPGVDYVFTPEEGIGSAYIMSHVPGETIARKILRDEEFAEARTKLSAQCGLSLAKVHEIDIAALPDLPVSDAAEQISQYEEIYRSFNAPRPVFELAVQWLRANLPDSATKTLVHGDFRHGNLMIDSSGLAAILDWELCHIGHPCEDIGWICVNSWRFGHSEKRVGGFGELADLLETYNRVRGTSFTEPDILFWEMLGSLKWGIMCMMMYSAFASGTDPSVERAAIGRRSSETEIDLINLLEHVA